jgi:hypothetical protein
MRLIVVLIASLIASAASAADGWREYIYLGLKFVLTGHVPFGKPVRRRVRRPQP